MIESGIKSIVIAMADPNKLTQNKSIQKLKKSGINVSVGLLQEDAKALNSAFVTYITQHRPHLTMKTAQTLDGKIATASGSVEVDYFSPNAAVCQNQAQSV